MVDSSPDTRVQVVTSPPPSCPRWRSAAKQGFRGPWSGREPRAHCRPSVGCQDLQRWAYMTARPPPHHGTTTLPMTGPRLASTTRTRSSPRSISCGFACCQPGAIATFIE
jgi:hypothetical protein